MTPDLTGMMIIFYRTILKFNKLTDPAAISVKG
jgi:hypothetical protein